MKKEQRFTTVITTDENEVVISLDSIMSIERKETEGVITLKNGAVYTAKVLNTVLEAIEKSEKGVDDLEERFGICVESQPQFLNVVSARSNVLINANAIIKVEPLSEVSSKITLIGEDHAVRVKSSIETIVATLANVVPVDAVDMDEV